MLERKVEAAADAFVAKLRARLKAAREARAAGHAPPELGAGAAATVVSHVSEPNMQTSQKALPEWASRD